MVLSTAYPTLGMGQQFANADAQDGNAILQHILGSDQAQITNQLAQETNMNNNQVTSVLDNMAPALLSGLSAATSSAQNSQQQSGSFDFSGLLSAFGGSSNSANTSTPAVSSGASGILGSILGGGTDSSSDGTNLISSLIGMLK